MTIFLVDEPFLEVALAYCSNDRGARIVLLQDAVYSALGEKLRGEVYAIDEEISRRGLRSRVPSSVRVIGYADLVKMMEEDRVVNFL